MVRSETLVIVWICLYDSRFPRRWTFILYPSWCMAQCCANGCKDTFRCTTMSCGATWCYSLMVCQYMVWLKRGV